MATTNSYSAAELRKKFLDFFERHTHRVVPSSSLIPADKSVLLTTAGMQQFVPYLSGEKDPAQEPRLASRRLSSVQKCFRTPDIEEVGDDTHHTFFEMLGNWSIGDYFKGEAIDLAWEFLTKEMDFTVDELWTTIFVGEGGIARDDESREMWLKKGVPAAHIREFGMDSNFWGPTATTGPCGPSTEIYYDRGLKYGCKQADCAPNCPRCQRFVEIWNLVFMEFFKDERGAYQPLPKKNVDTGMGLERFVPIVQQKQSAYETDLFTPLIYVLSRLCDTKTELEPHIVKRSTRIIVDHIRGACFLIADGIQPSKEDRGYVLRRVLRRAMRHARLICNRTDFYEPLAQKVIEMYEDVYPELRAREKEILSTISQEYEKFMKTLDRGVKLFDQTAQKLTAAGATQVSGQDAFQLFDTYGFPLELVQELAHEKGLTVDAEDFKKRYAEHQERSRAGAQKKFAGVGDYGEEVAAHHSATHLLHQAIRDVLGDHAHQAGSDMTPERLRFDFTHPDKLTDEQKRRIEDIVNEQIRRDLPVHVETMSPDQARARGAIGLFGHKYGEQVTVWFIGDYSKEVCGGPHVKHTSEIKGFKIIKEESSSAGTRRIKAVVGDAALKLLS